MLPDAIDRDAARQRIGRIDEPVRQIEPIRSFAARFERLQSGQYSRSDFIPLAQKIAAHMDERFHQIG